MLTSTGAYDDALIRFHRTGPEFEGYLSNHGPMVVEVLGRRNEDASIDRWTDEYLTRLDELPRGTWAIDPQHWQEALGEPARSSDWVELFLREVEEDPWQEVLRRWWPRLLPGIAAGATHGVIRVGHAVHALTEAESAPRVAELAHAPGVLGHPLAARATYPGRAGPARPRTWSRPFPWWPGRKRGSGSG